ncbi:MAG: peroxiredoxin [Proteobacteria bacterium]|nr:peroxiredoxin [Pseudomonadota bacterium]
MIVINQPVPDFEFESTDQTIQRLSDLKGRPLILYFYPKDHTSGCTLQAEIFRDDFSKYQKLNAIILGVSRDSVRSHFSFIEKLNLPFALISDKDASLCQLFNVIKPKTMYGKPVKGIERSTFLIDQQGVLRKEWRGVKVDGHSQQVLDALASL